MMMNAILGSTDVFPAMPSFGMLKVYMILLPLVALKIILLNLRISLELTMPEIFNNLSWARVVAVKSMASSPSSFLFPNISRALKSRYL